MAVEEMLSFVGSNMSHMGLPMWQDGERLHAIVSLFRSKLE